MSRGRGLCCDSTQATKFASTTRQVTIINKIISVQSKSLEDIAECFLGNETAISGFRIW
jgi:hypothetical protein